MIRRPPISQRTYPLFPYTTLYQSEIETSLLELAGDRIASELAATARRTEARTLRILQRSLLPSQLPEVDGLEFAERFVPGGLALVGDRKSTRLNSSH